MLAKTCYDGLILGVNCTGFLHCVSDSETVTRYVSAVLLMNNSVTAHISSAVLF